MACEPIKDKKLLKEFIEGLGMQRQGFVYQRYFEFGLSTALRVSDILSLKKKDIQDGYVRLVTQKTKKPRIIRLNDACWRNMQVYLQSKKDDELVFPFTRQNVHKFLKRNAEFIGMDKSKVSTHTTRKTAAYNYYINSGKDLALTQKFLGHKDPKVTMDYLMLAEEEVNKEIESQNMDWMNL